MYKHDAIIRAWLDGKEIQRLNDDKTWSKYGHLFEVQDMTGVPYFHVDDTFRIKPDTRKYRVMKWKDATPMIVSCETDAAALEQHTQFDKWLTDWVEYEV